MSEKWVLRIHASVSGERGFNGSKPEAWEAVREWGRKIQADLTKTLAKEQYSGCLTMKVATVISEDRS